MRRKMRNPSFCRDYLDRGLAEFSETLTSMLCLEEVAAASGSISSLPRSLSLRASRGIAWLRSDLKFFSNYGKNGSFFCAVRSICAADSLIYAEFVSAGPTPFWAWEPYLASALVSLTASSSPAQPFSWLPAASFSCSKSC